MIVNFTGDISKVKIIRKLGPSPKDAFKCIGNPSDTSQLSMYGFNNNPLYVDKVINEDDTYQSLDKLNTGSLINKSDIDSLIDQESLDLISNAFVPTQFDENLTDTYVDLFYTTSLSSLFIFALVLDSTITGLQLYEDYDKTISLATITFQGDELVDNKFCIFTVSSTFDGYECSLSFHENLLSPHKNAFEELISSDVVNKINKGDFIERSVSLFPSIDLRSNIILSTISEEEPLLVPKMLDKAFVSGEFYLNGKKLSYPSISQPPATFSWNLTEYSASGVFIDANFSIIRVSDGYVYLNQLVSGTGSITIPANEQVYIYMYSFTNEGSPSFWGSLNFLNLSTTVINTTTSTTLVTQTNIVTKNTGTNAFVTTPNITVVSGNNYSINVATSINPSLNCAQQWGLSNLNVTTYKNGDTIPQVTNPSTWASLTTGAWCYYNNDPANESIYGKLYNWYAVNDPRGLAPEGWHIPTNAEWETLQACLGGSGVAGGKMKTIGTTRWNSPNTGATNESGFSGLPGGIRTGQVGSFNNIGNAGRFWTSTEDGLAGFSKAYTLANDSATLFYGVQDFASGLSVRTIRNYVVGQSFGGGVIAYLLQPGDVGYDANVQHGLIASSSDINATTWSNGTNVLTGATLGFSFSLGSGLTNTNTIINAQGNTGSYAAKLCKDFNGGGYTDWYLPSYGELGKLYDNRIAIGGFDNSGYWSSTEIDISTVWYRFFFNGSGGGANKLTPTIPTKVRPIRTF